MKPGTAEFDPFSSRLNLHGSSHPKHTSHFHISCTIAFIVICNEVICICNERY